MMDSFGFHASLMYRERSLHGRDGFSSKRMSLAMKDSSQFVERFGLWKTLEGHDGCVNSVLFSNNGDHILTGSDDTIIKVFETFSTECVDSIRTIHRNNIFYAKDLPGSNDLEWIVSCAADGQVVLTNRVSRIGRRIYKHQGRAHRISIIPDEPFQFLSCGEDGACCLFDLREHVGSLFSASYGEDTAFSTLVTNNQLPNLKIEFFAGPNGSSNRGRPSSIYSVGVNPVREHEVAVGGISAKVVLFDLRQASTPFAVLCPKRLVRHMSHFQVTGVKYSHDGRSLLASYNDENVYLFDPVAFQRDPETYTPRWDVEMCENDTHSYGYLQTFKGHRNNETIKQVNFLGGKSKFVISGSDCGHAMIWDANEGSLLKVLKADSEGAVNCLDTHPTLPLLATSGLEHDAKLFLPILDGDCRALREEGGTDWRRAHRVLKGNRHNLEDIVFPTPVIKLNRDSEDSNDIKSDRGSDREEELRTRRNERQQWTLRLALQFLHYQRTTAAASDQTEHEDDEPPRSRRRLLFNTEDFNAFLEALNPSNVDESAEEDENDEDEENNDDNEDVEFFEEELNAEEQARMIFGDTQPDNEEDLLEDEEIPLVIEDTTSTPAMVSSARVLHDCFDSEEECDDENHRTYIRLQAADDDEDEMSLPVSPFPTPAHDMDEEVT